MIFSADRANDELALAHALLAHGKRAAAERFLARAKKDGAPPDSQTERVTAALRERSPDVP